MHLKLNMFPCVPFTSNKEGVGRMKLPFLIKRELHSRMELPVGKSNDVLSVETASTHKVKQNEH